MIKEMTGKRNLYDFMMFSLGKTGLDLASGRKEVTSILRKNLLTRGMNPEVLWMWQKNYIL